MVMSRIKGMSGKYRSKGHVSQTRLPPGLPSLKEWFERADLSLEDHQYEKLWMFHTLLRKKNEEYDLTRIYQFDSIVQKHYIDCVLVAKLLNWKLPSPLLDLGTGAGFPGIPLKIACPDVELVLSEGRHKRVQFLREVVDSLGLKGVTIYDHKVRASFNLNIRGVITRALESIPRTLALEVASGSSTDEEPPPIRRKPHPFGRASGRGSEKCLEGGGADTSPVRAQCGGRWRRRLGL